MAVLVHREKYVSRKNGKGKEEAPSYVWTFLKGWELLEAHPLLGKLYGQVDMLPKHLGNGAAAAATPRGSDRWYGREAGVVYVNVQHRLTAEEWMYTLAHELLHFAFGHFDRARMPGSVLTGGEHARALWNKACDIYVDRFLRDIRAGTPTCADPAEAYPIRLDDEQKIYEYLLDTGDGASQDYGTAGAGALDMLELDQPVTYEGRRKNEYAEQFYQTIAVLTSKTVGAAGGYVYDPEKQSPIMEAARWFIRNYPLLGSMAASFKIIEDARLCIQNAIEIAAVDAKAGEIYANPACGFSEMEWRFVLAHEFLHAGLQHHKRSQGRDPYLWNVACDYVVNGWLRDMHIGTMPEKGCLYDPALAGLSAEAIYDRITKDLRRYRRLNTFRGYGRGDVIGSGESPTFRGMEEGIGLDEFYRRALREGLDAHLSARRGFLPAGLVEEIRALAMPPIPWDVELAQWFDENFPPMEKHRTYARPSRRQSATPDIPRPRAVYREEDRAGRTFGVVLDTSGSMSARSLAKALGAIASYAEAKDVALVRVIYCDAEPYDAGYLRPEDLAEKAEIHGRGGTVLAPAVRLLEEAKDFPQDAPILVITDGWCDDHLRIHHEHAYLLPKGHKLPFRPEGKVFYFE